jgi:hypothetical protein
MKLTSIENLPEHIQADIDDIVNAENWQLVFYNPNTEDVRFYDQENIDSTKLMELQEQKFVQVNLGY